MEVPCKMALKLMWVPTISETVINPLRPSGNYMNHLL
jgi:hypothetical protein